MYNYDWLSKRTPRSVDELRPWAENPRLNPEDSHVTISDYIEDIIMDKADRDNFCALIKSIAERGFIPADPIVVWQNLENNKYYVAEGNRRVLACKILRNPDKAPRSIRGLVRKYSSMIVPDSIKKILVSIAPSFDAAEWYINQRNNASSLQRNWSRVQQQRWIARLYEKYNGDIDQILSITDLERSDVEGFIRILKLKDLIKVDGVKCLMSEEEFAKANSYKFPITILERFFNYLEVRNKWGIEYNSVEIIIKSNLDSFYHAYAELIKRIVNDGEAQINTRFKGDDIEKILGSLPKVTFDDLTSEEEQEGPTTPVATPSTPAPPAPVPVPAPKPLKNDPNRSRLILGIYQLNTCSTKLSSLFNELKEIPLKYNNAVAASIRVFLDLSVLNYIQTEGLESEIESHFHCNSLRDIPLKKRLDYLKSYKLTEKPRTIATSLLNTSNQYSLDVLNGYVHSNDTHYSSKQFLNGFWDFLFPLFENLLEIHEESN